MVPYDGQLLRIDAYDAGDEHRAEVFRHAGGNITGKTIIFCIHYGGLCFKTIQEIQCSGVHGSGTAFVHEKKERNIFIHDLKGTMEEFAVME